MTECLILLCFHCRVVSFLQCGIRGVSSLKHASYSSCVNSTTRTPRQQLLQLRHRLLRLQSLYLRLSVPDLTSETLDPFVQHDLLAPQLVQVSLLLSEGPNRLVIIIISVMYADALYDFTTVRVLAASLFPAATAHPGEPSSLSRVQFRTQAAAFFLSRHCTFTCPTLPRLSGTP